MQMWLAMVFGFGLLLVGGVGSAQTQGMMNESMSNAKMMHADMFASNDVFDFQREREIRSLGCHCTPVGIETC